jgi:hypothetical protein
MLLSIHKIGVIVGNGIVHLIEAREREGKLVS